MFVLTTHTGRQRQLEWGTLAMYHYCEKRTAEIEKEKARCKKAGVDYNGPDSYDLRDFGQEILKLQFSIPTLVTLIQAASLAAKQPEPPLDEVCEWIDECGGLLAQSGPLHDFANYIVKRTVLQTSDEQEEKKSQPTN